MATTTRPTADVPRLTVGDIVYLTGEPEHRVRRVLDLLPGIVQRLGYYRTIAVDDLPIVRRALARRYPYPATTRPRSESLP